ncbi:MAG: shikimate dehydrogenase [Pirellulales bacterium]
MICVSIGRGRHRQMVAEYKHLSEQGVGMVEMRVDWILRPVNLKRLLGERACPIVFTCRREADGGKWTKPESERQILLRSAIVAGVDYVDLEEDVASAIPRYGKTKRIISYHNFRETPENLKEIHQRLAALDADVVKLATMAHSQYDNLRMMRLVKEATIPTVGLCMGEVGMPSRVLCLRFGSPFTFATFHADRALAPGQLAFKDMRDLYRAQTINAETEVYGVVADPVAHSLSPRVHNAGFAQLGLNKVYVPFRVAREELPSFLANCREFGVKGLSITIPHKEEVLRYLSQTDEASESIGAVNTIDLSGPTAIGTNTDYAAALAGIIRTMGKEDRASPLEGVKALILGAGGVARAIVYGLQAAGAECTITNRTMTRAEDLARRFRYQAVEWNDRHTVKCDLIVNCTPVGMHPHVDESPFERRALHGNLVVFDTIYNPEQTLLVKEAREAGCAVITGVDMFVAQAARQFQVFTGKTPPVDVMREQVVRAITAVRS